MYLNEDSSDSGSGIGSRLIETWDVFKWYACTIPWADSTINRNMRCI